MTRTSTAWQCITGAMRRRRGRALFLPFKVCYLGFRIPPEHTKNIFSMTTSSTTSTSELFGPCLLSRYKKQIRTRKPKNEKKTKLRWFVSRYETKPFQCLYTTDADQSTHVFSSFSIFFFFVVHTRPSKRVTYFSKCSNIHGTHRRTNLQGVHDNFCFACREPCGNGWSRH